MNLMKWAWFLLCPMVAVSSVHASGDIAGTISDPSGAGIPKATILALETGKGIRHIAETDASGEYRLTGLPPARYDVTTQIASFQSQHSLRNRWLQPAKLDSTCFTWYT